MKDKRIFLLIVLSFTLAIASSAYIAYERVRAEQANVTVEIAADYGDIERLSRLANIPVRTVLAELRASGITSVALTEDLANDTDINITTGVDPKKADLYIPTKGLDPAKISLIASAKLNVIPRVRNSFAMNDDVLAKKINALAGYGTVIFAEEEVMGYPNYLKETAALLKTNNVKFGFVEFGKQFGDSELASYSGTNVVKVHSIPQEEMADMSTGDMLDRYIRAVRERNVRLLYVHLLQYPVKGKDLLSTNTIFIYDLKTKLVSSAFKTGKASSPSEIKITRPYKVMISLGIAGAAALLLNYFIPLDLIYVLALYLLVILLPSRYLATLASVVFPSFAVISQYSRKINKLLLSYVATPVSMVINVFVITAVGAIFLSSLLVTPMYMLGLSVFSGVKFAFILPILIVGAYFFMKDEKGEISFGNLADKTTDLLGMNLKLWHIAAFVAVAAAGALMLLRSGNFGVPVPGFERTARVLLENILVVRPRTKEFLIGYPALLLGAIYSFRGGHKWMWLMLAVGMLAPISMTNSFCHIHTPLIVTAARSCIGLILGIAFGVVLDFIFIASEKIIKAAMK